MLFFRKVLFLSLFAAAACGIRPSTPTIPEALEIGTPKTIFAATIRDPLPEGGFGNGRTEDYHLLELTVSIPPNHQPGQLLFAYDTPDPKTEFTMAARRKIETSAVFMDRLNSELAKFEPDERDITVFVHGFNSTQSETAFRAAQLTHDTKVPGATVVYSWPSLGSPLGYAYDADSVMFARDGLERLLKQLSKSNARRIVLVAHSMGSMLAMETLRQIEIRTPGWSDRNLDGVVLMSPDLDLDVFRSQMSRLNPVPQPFLVFISRKDKILTLSQRLRGTSSRARLGNLGSTDGLEDLPISIIDTTDYADSASSGHLVAGTSPALLAILSSARQSSKAFSRKGLIFDGVLPPPMVEKKQIQDLSLIDITDSQR
ncbi:alpha/beta hydrolase [Phaeobacter gallaeciensis]|uniref:alpha/beta hydrolase n=1 Tax=Phaeobacter gallaeciensis TaxID=60890 RepID=UPI00237F758A|nr:alpha/beta fold hydrolase [Phaeobacter gallaeciensis]MDE4192148.1 alpha/beta fold hydrolase [Phaeobacter gallaeciensis]MDE4200611.1 alpha/beta fold hydrolase [Phaeobacter gallaeciensis]MDE4204764.1 alpha/beta fold hydrolase [Phaeobacter gallaeciensis]MDE4208903.1 alpha/beta fold hydrolase [Phaeobacter gallaeciensis]MDE4217026.1 alpha/beta fold hydrolase [Phaeobacter gallaeciensis]